MADCQAETLLALLKQRPESCPRITHTSFQGVLPAVTKCASHSYYSGVTTCK